VCVSERDVNIDYKEHGNSSLFCRFFIEDYTT